MVQFWHCGMYSTNCTHVFLINYAKVFVFSCCNFVTLSQSHTCSCSCFFFCSVFAVYLFHFIFIFYVLFFIFLKNLCKDIEKKLLTLQLADARFFVLFCFVLFLFNATRHYIHAHTHITINNNK